MPTPLQVYISLVVAAFSGNCRVMIVINNSKFHLHVKYLPTWILSKFALLAQKKISLDDFSHWNKNSSHFLFDSLISLLTHLPTFLTHSSFICSIYHSLPLFQVVLPSFSISFDLSFSILLLIRLHSSTL